jgi:ribosome-associated heat shock protein Hsp15
MSEPRREEQRIDKWLWFARVAKTRTQAAALVTAGRVRLNSVRCEKASQPVRGGDVLTISVGGRVRILEVTAPGVRRGPPAEAQALFVDRSPPSPPRATAGAAHALREPGTGRPTKRERRQMDRMRDDGEEAG